MFKHIAIAAAALAAFGAQAALTAGDIAIIARTNNGSPDAFSFVALSDISAGEVIYFTDNGWTGSGYRSSTTTDGNGNESLTKWTASSKVLAGTIIASTSSDFTLSGSVPGASSGSFGFLDQSQSGEQFYAFQNTNSSNPLHNLGTQTSLYVLDDTNGFENATNSNTGNIAPGLTLGSTAVTLNFATGGTISVKASVLGTLGNDKAAWLAAFADANNWASATALPTGMISMAAVPEPESYALVITALGLLGLAARRSRA